MIKFIIKKQGKIINFSEIVKNLQPKVQQSLWRTGKQIKKTVQKDALIPKSGIKYKNLKRRSSSDEETSARQSGSKVKATTFNISRNRMTIGIDKNIKYAEAIEKGTKHIKARKDIEKAVKKNLTFAKDDLQKTLNLIMNDNTVNYK
jgi:hypothetical protein